jgi:hypothetical protein
MEEKQANNKQLKTQMIFAFIPFIGIFVVSLMMLFYYNNITKKRSSTLKYGFISLLSGLPILIIQEEVIMNLFVSKITDANAENAVSWIVRAISFIIIALIFIFIEMRVTRKTLKQ